MLESQKIQVRQSEMRTAIRVLLDKGEPTDVEKTELSALRNEQDESETSLRAAIETEGVEATATVETPEKRELAQLTERSNLGSILSAVVEHRATGGPELELQQHHGLAINQIPLDMLRLRPEERALTPAPTNTETMQDEIVQPVFADSAGAFLGVFQPTVAMGDAVYPVLTSRPVVGGPHTDSTDVGETTGAFDSELLAPGRIQASFFWKRTDSARFPTMEASLRMALNSGLAEKADQEIINGSKGLLNGSNLGAHNVAAVTAFADYLSEFCYARVDGRYATGQDMLRIVMGSGTYAHAGTVYRSNNADFSVLDSLMQKTGGVKVSSHVPAVASNKQNSVIRLGMRRDMVQPLWNGITVVVDEVTRSGKGEIEVTAVMLLATQIIRAAGFYKQQTQHA